jgi:hypothetical protein
VDSIVTIAAKVAWMQTPNWDGKRSFGRHVPEWESSFNVLQIGNCREVLGFVLVAKEVGGKGFQFGTGEFLW